MNDFFKAIESEAQLVRKAIKRARDNSHRIETVDTSILDRPFRRSGAVSISCKNCLVIQFTPTEKMVFDAGTSFTFWQ